MLTYQDARALYAALRNLADSLDALAVEGYPDAVEGFKDAHTDALLVLEALAPEYAEARRES